MTAFFAQYIKYYTPCILFIFVGVCLLCSSFLIFFSTIWRKQSRDYSGNIDIATEEIEMSQKESLTQPFDYSANKENIAKARNLDPLEKEGLMRVHDDKVNDEKDWQTE